MKSIYTKQSIYLLIALLSLSLSTSCNSGKDKKDNWAYYQDRGSVFATGYSIKYAYDKSLKTDIETELERFDRSLNPFRKDAVITKFNKNEDVEIDSFFVNVLRRSRQISEQTNGYFDITVSPYINAWGFGFENIDSVTPELIDSLRAFVGYDKISVDNDGNIVKSDPRVEINTSAIAKGYACDVIADLLESYGVRDYMVEIGGEVSAKGVNDKGVCWRIGVDKPIDDFFGRHDLHTILSLCDMSLATSGNYRNYYIKDGKKYSHTIDPFTGYPAETDLLGATVLADDCMTADAYATAFMAMGVEKACKIADKVEGLHYYFIFADKNGEFEVVYSDGFEQFLPGN